MRWDEAQRALKGSPPMNVPALIGHRDARSRRWVAACVALAFGAVVVVGSCTSGCASGPQLPIVTPVVNISCTVNMPDAGSVEAGADAAVDYGVCWIDGTRTAGEAVARGIEAEGTVSPTTDTRVGGVVP